jgi:hypothetical protein
MREAPILTSPSAVVTTHYQTCTIVSIATSVHIQISHVANLHEARQSQAVATAMINQARRAYRVGPTQPLLLCDSGRAGEGAGVRHAKPPRTSNRRSRLDPRTPSSEKNSAPPVVTRLLT